MNESKHVYLWPMKAHYPRTKLVPAKEVTNPNHFCEFRTDYRIKFKIENRIQDAANWMNDNDKRQTKCGQQHPLYRENELIINEQNSL